jgi:hypothetical protein
MKLGIITSAAAFGLVLGSLMGLSSSQAHVPVSHDYSMTRPLIGFERGEPGEPVVQAAPVIQATPVTIVAHKASPKASRALQWTCSAPSRLMAGAEDTPMQARSSDTQTVRKCEWR